MGIAIEHGQNNLIAENSFSSDKTAIKLWARKSQPAGWGYAQKRDVRSTNYILQNNRFNKNNIGIQASFTDSLQFSGNEFQAVELNLKFDSTVHADPVIKTSFNLKNADFIKDNLPGKCLKDTTELLYSSLHAGRKEIRITKWGPYNYNYPILWLSKEDSTGHMSFELLGPKGKWKIRTATGVSKISAVTGTFPAILTAQKTSDNIKIDLIYTGEKFITQSGKKEPANVSFHFSYNRFDPGITWVVKWYRWDTAHNPNKNYSLYKQLTEGPPLKSVTTNKLDYTWWAEPGKELPADSFATVATSIIKVPKGKYEIGVTADDLVKVFMDGKLVIDFWDVTKYINDEDAHHRAVINMDGKVHSLRVEHAENTGFATLIFTIEPIMDSN